ncbi:MAG: ankyrin repeat domain-containing protein [Candidatus Algichlamydia australiensis]|nr:ankyrin repeat domain-containing protein [Chlamydiales bacterium]
MSLELSLCGTKRPAIADISPAPKKEKNDFLKRISALVATGITRIEELRGERMPLNQKTIFQILSRPCVDKFGPELAWMNTNATNLWELFEEVLIDQNREVALFMVNSSNTIQTAISSEISKGNQELLDLFIKMKFFPIDSVNSRITLLHSAATCDETEGVKKLLEQGFDINAKDERGETVLHYAVKSCQLNTIQVLISSLPELDINAADIDGNTALHMAVFGRDFQTIKDLLRHGADPSRFNKKGESPLFLAIKNQDRQLMEALFHSGDERILVSRSDDLMTPTQYAVLVRSLPALVFLNDYGLVDLSSCQSGCDPLYQLLISDYFSEESFFHLWDGKFDLTKKMPVSWNDEEETTYLHQIVKRRFTKVLELFSMESKKSKPLLNYLARRELGEKNAFNLVNPFSIRNEWGDTLLHTAVRTRDKATIEVVLRANRDSAFVKNSRRKRPTDLLGRNYEELKSWLQAKIEG